MSFSIPEVLEIIVIYQCITFAVNLIIKDNTQPDFNSWLAILLIVIAFNFLNVVLLSIGILAVRYNFGLFFGFLYGPLFFIYTVKTIHKNVSFPQKVNPAHFAPAAIGLLLIIIGIDQTVAQALVLVTILVVLHILTYIFFSVRKIVRLQEALKSNFSTIENKNLNWLKWILIIFAVIILFTLVEAALSDHLSSQYNLPLLFINLFTLLTINLIYFRGLSYPELFNDYVIRTGGQKYTASKLSAGEAVEKLNRVESHMEKNKPYLEFELTIKDLAEQVGLNPRELSQVINEKRKMNFYEFVNHYRLEEAKKLLLEHDGEAMRIKEVMYAAGFSSKSTFNSIFKKSTGRTPRQFRQEKTSLKG